MESDAVAFGCVEFEILVEITSNQSEILAWIQRFLNKNINILDSSERKAISWQGAFLTEYVGDSGNNFPKSNLILFRL